MEFGIGKERKEKIQPQTHTDAHRHEDGKLKHSETKVGDEI
jgi:hypothetical protein